MSKNRLSRLEEQIERLVEGSFARLFAGRLHPRQVAVQLARAMEDHARPNPGRLPTAPDTYTVYLNRQDHAALLAAQPDLAKALGAHLVDLASRLNLRMSRFPTVTFTPSLGVAQRQVRVVAEHAEEMPPTAVFPDAGSPDIQPPPGARLLVEVTREIPLNRPVTNIGRQLDNHIVIDDPRVSRRHAQLRLRQGRYVLFDLGSRRGVTVNDQRVQECVLRSGDRIAFGGVPALYIDHAPGAPARQDTQRYE
ncbi:MAG: FHA domain-containing protein [Anaerolineae bacterium]|nr:FHA domain-containing protein [Anaerolineae bacterium]